MGRYKYEFRETVYLVTDPMQDMYFVVGYEVRENETFYIVGNHNGEKKCYEFELSNEKTIF